MELLERDQQLQQLASALEACRTAGGRSVLVSGEAGVGKTSLVRFFADGQQKHRVLWGSCEDLFTARVLGPLHDIVGQVGGSLEKLLATESRRTSLFSAFLDELRSGEKPAIVVFEDVHWADEATLDLIKFIGRRIHQTSSLLLLTFRDDELGPTHLLRFVIGELPSGLTTRIRLLPFSENAVSVMATRAGRSPEDLYKVTRGNPFFVSELLAADSKDTPATVRDAVLARAARLAPEGRDVLDLASLMPLKAERWLIDAILSPRAEDIDACVHIGLLQPDASWLAFRHELARRAVEDALSPTRALHFHSKILAALVQAAVPEGALSRIVHHATHAQDPQAVLRFAPRAADAAALLGAHREARSHLAAALQHAASLESADHALMLERFAYECYLTGDIEEAIRARSMALRFWTILRQLKKQGHNLRWLSRLLWFLGKKEEAGEYAVRAVETLEGLPPDQDLAMAYSNKAQLHMLAEETEAAIAWGKRAIDIAESLGDKETLAHALNNVGTAQMTSGDPQGRMNLQKSLELSLQGGFEEHAARAYTNLGSTFVHCRDHANALLYLQDGIAYCTDHDLDAWLLYKKASLAQCRFQQGLWTEAADIAASVLSLERVAPITRIPALVALARVRIRRGDPGAREVLEEARVLAIPTGELQRIGPVTIARAEAAWLAGNTDGCKAEAEEAFRLARQFKNPWEIGELGFWVWRGNGPVGDLRDLAPPFARQISGDWRGAAELWQNVGCPYERALALADGDPEAQRRALSIFEELGASPAATLVRRRLRKSGVRNIPRGPRRSTKENPASLTRREMQILGLINEGLQNAAIAERLFISGKTVEHHVSSLFTKLNAHSRSGAVAIARGLGLLRH